MFRGLSPRPGITQGTESVRRDLVDLVAKTEVSWTTGGLAGSKSTWKRPGRNDPNRPVAGASFLLTFQWHPMTEKSSVNYMI